MNVKAWHFLADAGVMRDGREPPPDSEWLEHEGELDLCRSGLHASKRAIDALQYAPGALVCRVECAGEIVQGDDKLVCSRRRILWRADATEALHKFARLCALDVIDKWDAPKVVVRYLKTGDEEIRAAARDAAWDAARDAARAAARDAARAVARAAARDAARAAARDVARAVARAAARAAARDVARAAAWDAQNKRLTRMFNDLRRGTNR